MTDTEALRMDAAPEPAKRNFLTQLSAVIGWIAGLMEPLRKFTVNAVIMVVLVLSWPFLHNTITKSRLIVKDITVPHALADRGFSGDVIAQQLLDQISVMNRLAGSKKQQADISGFDIDRTMPAIDLPVGGINLGTLINEVRQLLGYTDTKISGEVFIEAPTGDDKGGQPQYGLRLRIAGHGPLFKSSQPAAKVDELIEAAAEQIMHKFDPVNLGYYYYRKKDFKRAYETTETTLLDDTAGNDAWAYSMRGLLARDRGDFREAAANFRQVISIAPNFWMGYVNLADLLRLDGKLDEAEQAARRAITAAPREQEGHAALALVMLDQGKRDEALAEMKTGVAMEPKDARGHFELGRMLHRLERYEEALTSFRASAEIAPGAETLIHAANASKSLKRKDEEISFLRQAANAEPKNPDAWLALGAAALEQGDTKQAKEAFEKAASLEPNSSDPLLRLTGILASEKRYAEAAAIYAKQAATFRRDPEFLTAWSAMLWDSGKKPAAAAKLHEALDAAADKPGALGTIGRTLEARGEVSEAIVAYDMAIAADPGVADIIKPHIEKLKARLPATPDPHAPARSGPATNAKPPTAN